MHFKHCLAMGLMASAAGTATMAAAADAPIVGLITKTETNPFFVKMKEGALQAAKAQGARLLTASGKSDGDNAGQISAIENMVSAGAKAILITPSDSKAIVPAIKRARSQGVMVIALDSPAAPQDATDALFATDNYQAGSLIGQYARVTLAGKPLKVAMLDLLPGHPVGIARHNGFLAGLGMPGVDARTANLARPAAVVCMADTYGDQGKGQTAMENCLQKNPDINLVYAINEPAAAGAHKALKAAGKEKSVMIVSIDGGCAGVRDVKAGAIAATAQQYPLRMASLAVDAGVQYARTGKKAGGYVDTGTALITDKPATGVGSKDTAFGLGACWGK
jgi:fructose transport system substrate-binding protein